MTDYRTELAGQGNLLDLAPRPRPHEGIRLLTLELLESATDLVDAHWIARQIEDQESSWIGRRLGELADEGHAVRVATYDAKKGRPRTLWAATTNTHLTVTPAVTKPPKCPQDKTPLEHLHGTHWRCATCRRGYTHRP